MIRLRRACERSPLLRRSRDGRNICFNFTGLRPSAEPCFAFLKEFQKRQNSPKLHRIFSPTCYESFTDNISQNCIVTCTYFVFFIEKDFLCACTEIGTSYVVANILCIYKSWNFGINVLTITTSTTTTTALKVLPRIGQNVNPQILLAMHDFFLGRVTLRVEIFLQTIVYSQSGHGIWEGLEDWKRRNYY